MKKLLTFRRLFITLLAIGFVSFFPASLKSQARLAGRMLSADLAPALLVKLLPGDTAPVPLGISDIDIDIKVTGNIAVTTMSLNFYNDVDRNLEGEFVFPLAEGQTIHYFAMDVQGKMREGVVVEKAQGREVFESVIRRKIDPGLLEWTQGNNFKARVFPIPAKGYKKFIIGFQQELQSPGTSFIYSLPLAFRNKVRHFSIKAEVNGAALQPAPTGENAYLLSFNKVADKWLAQVEYKDIIPDKPVSFEIPFRKNSIPVYIEKIAGAGDSYYFYALVHPEQKSAEKKLPHKLGIIWDVSGSASSRNREKEMAVIEQYLNKIENASVSVLAFSTAIHAQKDFRIVHGNSVGLRSYLSTFEPDGATQLGCLDLANTDLEEFLMFSDGVQNFGSSNIKFPKCAVHCISTGNMADFSMLQYISRSTGGKFINAQAIEAGEVIKQLMQTSFNFISSQTVSGNVSQVYPSLTGQCSDNFGIAGIIKGKPGTVHLNFGTGSTASLSIQVTIDSTAHSAKNVIGRIWAQKKIAELDLRFDYNRDEITRLGKKFSVVTRNTSLLVLDRLADYIQYHITPPDSSMKRAYLEALKAEKGNTGDDEKENFEDVLNDFAQRVAWWKKDFTPVKAPPQKSKTTGSNSSTDSARVSTIYCPNFGSSSTLPSPPSENATRTTVHFVDPDVRTVVQQPPAANTVQRQSLHSDNINSLNEVVITSSKSVSKMSESAVSIEVMRSSSLTNAISRSPGVSVQNGYAYKWDPANDIEQNPPGNLSDNAVGEFKLKEWDPKTPYMDELKKTSSDGLYKKYLGLRKQYELTPSFFIDAADYFEKMKKRADAVRILSNLAELQSENHELMRVMAHRLQQWNENKPAIAAFEKVEKMRPGEPQSPRDLGLAYAQNGQYQKAVDMLCKVVNNKPDADDRFPGIEALTACEINHIMAQSKVKLRLDSLDKRLVKNMPVDVRVVINWDANDCDIDLWVTDPSGEKCYYGHTETKAGGRISDDFTDGYGPEEFLLKKALPGKYKVQINYFADHQQTLAGPTTVQAEMYTNYGRPNEVKKEITVRLTEAKEVIDIGEFEFVK